MHDETIINKLIENLNSPDEWMSFINQIDADEFTDTCCYWRINNIILSLYSDYLSELVVQKLAKISELSTNKNRIMVDEYMKLQKSLMNEGIKCYLVKGPVASIYIYGDMYTRRYADLDILVKETDVYKSFEILHNMNFEQILVSGEVEEISTIPEPVLEYRWDFHEYLMHKQVNSNGENIDIYIELATSISSIPNITMQKFMLGNDQKIRTSKGEITTFNDLHILLTTIMNAFQDLVPFVSHDFTIIASIKYIPIFDLFYIVKHKKVNWEELFLLAKSYGLHEYTLAVFDYMEQLINGFTSPLKSYAHLLKEKNMASLLYFNNNRYVYTPEIPIKYRYGDFDEYIKMVTTAFQSQFYSEINPAYASINQKRANYTLENLDLGFHMVFNIKRTASNLCFNDIVINGPDRYKFKLILLYENNPLQLSEKLEWIFPKNNSSYTPKLECELPIPFLRYESLCAIVVCERILHDKYSQKIAQLNLCI